MQGLGVARFDWTPSSPAAPPPHGCPLYVRVLGYVIVVCVARIRIRCFMNSGLARSPGP